VRGGFIRLAPTVESFPMSHTTGSPARVAALTLVLIMSGCASSAPDLRATGQYVDLERFMGDWYVLAAIPVEIPFFSEAEAYNAVESYRLGDNGRIETTYRFRKGGFDGPEKIFRPTGFVHNRDTNAEWRMQFIWPFKAPYLVLYRDDDYRQTIIGVPDRRYAWIMAREPKIGDEELGRLEKFLADTGHDMSKLRRVPQRWPDQE